MLNINDLERRWLYYKIKSYIPHAIIIISTITISIIIVNTMHYNSSKETQQDKSEQIANVEKTDVQTVVQTEKIIPNAVNNSAKRASLQKEPIEASTKVEEGKRYKETKTAISPSLAFMAEMQKSTTKIVKQIPDAAKQTRRVSEEESVQEQVIFSPIEEINEDKPIVNEEVKNEEPVVDEEIKGTINITKQHTQNDIENVIKRFKKSNSPALSLFIAKNYYAMGDYNLAYNYALITNEIDNNIEASWIIFARSLVKLGQKQKAIETLNEYIRHSHSSSAKSLLDSIVSGEMK